MRSFDRRLDGDETGVYVFVLEDSETLRCVGTSLILAKTGVPGAPYYWFECSTEERRSAALDKRFALADPRWRGYRVANEQILVAEKFVVRDNIL